MIRHLSRVAALIATLSTCLALPVIAHAQNYSSTGSVQTYVVPANVTGLSVSAVGGAGGNGAWTPGIGGASQAIGAPGGTTQGMIPVTPGEKLFIYVGAGGGQAQGMSAGSGGWAGDFTGGDGGTGVLSDAGGGGGGATVITREDGTVLLVAGGGGGAGGDGVNGPGFGQFVGGNGGIGGISPQAGGGGTGNQNQGAGGKGGADTNNKHGGKGGLGAATTGAGGGGGGGRWAGHGGNAGEVRINVGLVETAGGGGGGGASYVIDGTRSASYGTDNQSAGAGGSLSLTTAVNTTTSISVENPGDLGPNNRGILFTANVANGGTGGTVAFTAVVPGGGTPTLCAAAPVVNGVATCAPTLAVGRYDVSAAFSGNFRATASSSVTPAVKVIGRGSKVTFVNPPSQVPANTTITLTVNIDNYYPGQGIQWIGAPGNCPTTVQGPTSSCTFTTADNTYVQNVTVRYTGGVANTSVVTVGSEASISFVVSRPREVSRNTIFNGTTDRFAIGGSVTYTACFQGQPTAPKSQDYCPAPNLGYVIQTGMADATCSAYYDQNLRAGAYNGAFVYTCKPLHPGVHTIYTEYHKTGNPYGTCDGATNYPPGQLPVCVTGFYFPSASTTVVALGPPDHLNVTTSNPAPSVYEPFTVSADVRDSGEDLLTNPIGTVTYTFVNGNGAADPSLGRCFSDGRCIAGTSGELRVRARNSAGLVGYVTEFVPTPTSTRVVTLPSNPVISSTLAAAQTIRATVNDSIYTSVPVDFFVDGYAATIACGHTNGIHGADTSPLYGLYADCSFQRGVNMPAPGDHELIAAFREPGQPVATARTTLHVIGARVGLKFTAVGTNLVAGGSIPVEVHGVDSNGDDTGVVDDQSLQLSIDGGDNSFCNPGNSTCSTDKSGPHLITARSGGLMVTTSVTVGADKLTRITAADSETVHAGYVATLGLIGYDRFGNVVPNAMAQATLEMNGVPCPNHQCIPTYFPNGRPFSTVQAWPNANRSSYESTTTNLNLVAGDPVAPQLALQSAGGAVGDEVGLTVLADDAWGNHIDDPMSVLQLTIDGGSCAREDISATFYINATCTPTKAGTRTITATTPNGAKTTRTITVNAGAEEGLFLRPEVTSTVAGNRIYIPVSKADRYGNALDAVRPENVVWSYNGGAYCGGYGGCDFFDAGEIEVRASLGDLRGSAMIHVDPAPASVLQMPTGPKSVVAAGETFSVDIAAYDEFFNKAHGVAAQIAATFDGRPCLVVDSVDEGVATATCRAALAGAREFEAHVVALPSASVRATTEVTYGNPAQLTINGPDQITSGDFGMYSATAIDAAGNDVPVPAYHASFDLDGLTCFGGACVGRSSGPHTVTVSYMGVTAHLAVTVVAGAPTTLEVTGPSEVAAGNPATFSAIASDANGNIVGIVDATYGLDDAGPCEGNSCVTNVAGEHAVSAEYQGATGSTTLEVTPGVAVRYEVTAGATTVIAGTTVPVTVHGTDAYDNRFLITDGVELTTANGFCLGAGCTPAQVTSATFLASVDGSYVGSATVAVTPAAAAKLAVSPAEVTRASGESVTYAVNKLDFYDNVVGAASGATGTIDAATPCAANVCAASGIGDHPVVFTSPGLDSASATIHVTTGPLDHIGVTASALSITAGDSVHLTLSGADEFGNPIAGPFDDVTYFDSDAALLDDGVPIDCPNQNCTLTRATTHMLHVFVGAAEADVQVDVTPSTLAQVALTLPDGSLSSAAGDNFAVGAVGFDAYFNIIGDVTSQTTFSFERGTCDNGAAPTCTSTVPDLHTLTGSIGSISNTYDVRITTNVPKRLVLDIDPGVPNAGQPFSVYVTAYDASGNLIGDRTDYASITLDGDACSAFAGCAATSAGRTHHLYARDGQGEGSLDFTVGHASPSSLAIEPSVSSITTDGTRTYIVSATDMYDNLFELTDGVTLTGSNGATCIGLTCSASNVGAHTITASVAGIPMGTASLYTSVGALASLHVDGPTANVGAGAATAFTVTGYDHSGNERGDATDDATFSIAGGTCTNNVCSAKTVGDHVVTATIGAVTSQDFTIHVVAGAPSYLQVSGPTSMVAGTAGAFTATAFDVNHNEIGDVTATAAWDIDDTAGISGCSHGSCIAALAGPHEVAASLGRFVHGAANVTVTHGPLQQLRISPNTWTITTDDQRSYTYTGVDAFSNPVTVAASDVTLSIDGSRGSCTGNTCGSHDVDEHTVTATAASNVTTTAALTVTPGVLTNLRLSHATSGDVPAGSPVTVSAVGVDAYGNARDGDLTADATFSITNGTCAANVCVSHELGDQDITATMGATTSLPYSVNVVPSSLDHLVVAGPSSLTAGGSGTYTATGYDAFDNLIGDETNNAMFTLSDAKAHCDASQCFAHTAGTFDVTASLDGATGSTSVAVAHADLDAIAVSPKTMSITADERQEYHVAGADEFGNAVPVASGDIVLTIDGDDCDGSYCDSADVGSHDIVATVGTSTDAATLTVTPGALHSLTLSADNDTVAADVGATFTATGLDAYNNSIGNVTADTTFTVAGGTCVANVCSSKVAGDHVVTAHDGATVTGTFTLHVTHAALDHLVVSGPATLVAGVDGTYTAAGFDAFDNTLGDQTSTAAFAIDGIGHACVANVCQTHEAGARTVSAYVGDDVAGRASVTITHAAEDHLVLATAASHPAHTAFAVTAMAQDKFDNDIADVTSTTKFYADDADCTAANCTIDTVGHHTISANHNAVSNGATGVDVVAAPAIVIDVANAHASMIANGVSTSPITVTLHDAYGNPVLADEVNLSALPALNAPTLSNVTKVGDGTYTATLTASNTAGSWTITATDTSVTPYLVSTAASYTQTHDAAAHATLTLAPTSIVADGASTTQATVHVTDSHGNAINDAAVVLTTDGGQSIGAVTSLGNGDYRSTITSTTKYGASSIHASVSGTQVGAKATLAQLSGVAATSTVTLADGTLTADGHSTTTATVRFADTHGNPILGGGAATITSTLGVQVTNVVAHDDGSTTATLTTALQVGTATVTATSAGVTGTASLVLKVRASAPGTQPVTNATADTIMPPASNPTSLPNDGHTTHVTVACPTGAIGSCAGTVKITLTSVAGSASSGPVITAATGTFTLAPGGSTALDLPLSADIRAKLAANPNLQVLVTVTVTDEVGNTTSVTTKHSLSVSKFRGVTIGGSVTLDAAAKFAPISITCPKTAVGGCAGTLRLDVLVDSSFLRKVGYKLPALASRSISLKAGTTVVLQIKLNPLAAKLLATRRTLRVLVSANTHDTVTGAQRTSRRIQLHRAH